MSKVFIFFLYILFISVYSKIISSFFLRPGKVNLSLANLMCINLNDNPIESIEDDTFQRFKKLEVLALANNRLSQIDSNKFKQLHSSIIVDLRGNQN